MNTHQDNPMPKRTYSVALPPKRTYSVALLGEDGYTVRTLQDTTYFSNGIIPLVQEVRDKFGPVKAALVVKETVEWMRSVGLMSTVEEIEFVMEIVSALQEGRQLPTWASAADLTFKTLEDKVPNARSDTKFTDFLSKVLSSPRPDDGSLEDIVPIDPVSPTPGATSVGVVDSGFSDGEVWPSEGNDSEAFGSISVQISGPSSDVKYALEVLVDAVDDEIEYLKSESAPLKFHVSQTLQTVQ